MTRFRPRCVAALRFLGFGTGLDPRQAVLFGPQLGTILVGLSLGISTAATTGVADGYACDNMNPARCLALSVARGDFACECTAPVLGCFFCLVADSRSQLGEG